MRLQVRSPFAQDDVTYVSRCSVARVLAIRIGQHVSFDENRDASSRRGEKNVMNEVDEWMRKRTEVLFENR